MGGLHFVSSIPLILQNVCSYCRISLLMWAYPIKHGVKGTTRPMVEVMKHLENISLVFQSLLSGRLRLFNIHRRPLQLARYLFS